jgi:hypothetical protein
MNKAQKLPSKETKNTSIEETEIEDGKAGTTPAVPSKHVGFEEDTEAKLNIFETGEVQGAEGSDEEEYDSQDDMSDSNDY